MLLACTWAAPADPYAPYAPAPYAPAPAPYHPPDKHYVEKEPPKPYVYEYGGVDYNGQAFAKQETQDEYGVVQGLSSSFSKEKA